MPPSSALNTGSASGRGMQLQTTHARWSISALNEQLPITPRLRSGRGRVSDWMRSARAASIILFVQRRKPGMERRDGGKPAGGGRGRAGADDDSVAIGLRHGDEGRL